jgi:hypothetical protein
MTDYDGALDGFGAAARKAEIEADLTYRFGAIHDENKGLTQKDSYVESLFLTGDARETAIDAEIANVGAIEGALPSSVAMRLLPLLKVGSISGGGSAAAENANIIARDVVLVAGGSAVAGQGRIGTLTAPVDIDFTLDLNALPDAERLDQQNLRRSLQVQDISQVVHQIYLRTGAETTLAEQPEKDALAAETGWQLLNMRFTTLTSGTSVTMAKDDVIGIWAPWPKPGQAEPDYTYRLFQKISNGTSSVLASSVNWNAPGSGWTEVVAVKSFANDPVSVTVSTGNVFADIWNVVRVSARPFADVNLRASEVTVGQTDPGMTRLTMQSAGMAGIGHDGTRLDVVSARSGGFLRIVTTGSLADVANGAYAAEATGYISLIASRDIGASATPFRVNATAGTTLLLQSGGDAFIRQAGGDLVVSRALTGGTFRLETPANLALGDIDVGGQGEAVGAVIIRA